MKIILFLLAVFLLPACAPAPGLDKLDPTPAAPTLTPAPLPTLGEGGGGEGATSTVSPTPSLPIADPALAAALKKHPGLEASIAREADGRFIANVTLLSPDGIADPAALEVDPSTLTENLALIGKNKYADTPVMTAADGTKLYWIQEYKTWYAKAGEGSIHNPWRVPYGRGEVSARMGIADHPEDFPQAAVERWSSHQYQNALAFEWRLSNRYTKEGKKFGFLDNMSLVAADLTQENTPVQILAHDWYAVELPDGTLFRYFQLKWLDPKDPRNPKADEWKIIQVAPGMEITDVEYNRNSFSLQITRNERDNKPFYRVMPIFKTDEGFFDDAFVMQFVPILQPSLAKLLDEVTDKFANLKVPVSTEPGEPNWTYKTWIDYWWRELSKDKLSGGFGFGVSETQYDDEIFSQQFQTFIFPAFVMRR